MHDRRSEHSQSSPESPRWGRNTHFRRSPHSGYWGPKSCHLQELGDRLAVIPGDPGARHCGPSGPPDAVSITGQGSTLALRPVRDSLPKCPAVHLPVRRTGLLNVHLGDVSSHGDGFRATYKTREFTGQRERLAVGNMKCCLNRHLGAAESELPHPERR